MRTTETRQRVFAETWGDAGERVVLVHGSLATGADEWPAQLPSCGRRSDLRIGDDHERQVAALFGLAEAFGVDERAGGHEPVDHPLHVRVAAGLLVVGNLGSRAHVSRLSCQPNRQRAQHH